MSDPTTDEMNGWIVTITLLNFFAWGALLFIANFFKDDYDEYTNAGVWIYNISRVFLALGILGLILMIFTYGGVVDPSSVELLIYLIGAFWYIILGLAKIFGE